MTLAATAGRRKRERRPVSGPPPGENGAPDAAALLAWYDRHRRRLPWRALPGETADPYRIWLSEIMLQQTTVKTVGPYFERFLARWPDVGTLAAAPLDEVLREWAGLGYYARARNLHACAKAVVEKHGGRFPEGEAALRALPGIGDYTAAAVAAIAFGQPATPVDGNIERVTARLFAVADELPAAKARIRALAKSLTPPHRAGDFAQGMMDLGATICTPRRPACALCPWTAACAAYATGNPVALPRKAPKAHGKLRLGAAFWILRADAHVLVRTRPERGLLGGMTEIPGSQWRSDFNPRFATADAPRLQRLDGRHVRLNWRRLPGSVSHVFTHFPLELVVCRAFAPSDACAPEGMRWAPLALLDSEALPTLIRKVIAHALAAAE